MTRFPDIEDFQHRDQLLRNAMEKKPAVAL